MFPADWGKKQALFHVDMVLPYTISRAVFGIYKPTVQVPLNQRDGYWKKKRWLIIILFFLVKMSMIVIVTRVFTKKKSTPQDRWNEVMCYAK